MSQRGARRMARLKRLGHLRDAELQADEELKPDQCPTGKKIYKKRRFADAEAQRLTVVHGKQHYRYHCRHCRHYHTTTRGAGVNPETQKYEDPRKAARAAPAATLAGCSVVRLVKRA